jgi:hypothetical protein
MIDLLRQRLQSYSASNAVQEEQALKEMLQEIAPFLPATEQISLTLWNERFFADKVKQIQ